MPFQPVPNTAQFEVIFDSLDQIVENIYYVERASPWTEAQLETTNDAIIAWWKAEIAPIVPASVSLLRVDSRGLHSEADVFFSTPCLTDCEGTLANAQLPNNCTVCVKWNTGLTGRSQRGRTYHIGLAEAQVTGNSVNVLDAAGILNAYTELTLALEAAIIGSQHVVVSRISGGVPRTNGQTTPVTLPTLDTVVDSQRRRLPGRGS